MKKFAVCLGLLFLAGCGSDGIVINGIADVTQLDVRRTPIIHYNLPTEVIDPITSKPTLDFAKWQQSNLAYNNFTELPFPGHDLWAMFMDPTNPMGDWVGTHDQYKVPGPGWPNPNFSTIPPNGRPAAEYIAAWVLSFQNQWFLRDYNGAAIVAQVPGDPPVRYDGAGFASMGISIHEVDVAVSPFSQLLQSNPATPAQQEVGDPLTVGFNNVLRIAVPANNVLAWVFQPNAPAGLMGASWKEAPLDNKCIETSVGGLVGVPVPDYFGGGGAITCTGGVFMQRYSDNWQQTTSGSASTTNINDGVTYSYFLAVIGNHLIGYGLGLTASSFALPTAVTEEDHIMTTSVVYDLTAFIASGKKFQFQLKDLLIMQDVVTGTFQSPGSNSTLPGTFR